MRKLFRFAAFMGALCCLATAPLSGQKTYIQGMWDAYQQAPDFTAKKAAFKRLENFYRYYHIDSCILICEDFLKKAEQEKSDYKPFIETRIAGCQIQKLNFDKASDMLYPLLKQAETEHNDSLRASVLITLSNLAFRQNQLPQALQRAREAARINENEKRWTDLVINYNMIANVYNKLNQDSAIFFYQKGLDIMEHHGVDAVATASLFSNMGTCYHRKGEMDKAIDYYKRAVSEYERVDERYGRCFALLNIGHAFKKMKQYKEALPWFDKALPVCETCGNTEGVGSIYMGRSQVYEGLGDYKAALEAEQKLSETQGKLNQQTYNRTTQELEAKYQTEKKERQLAQEKNRRTYLLATLGLLVLLGGGLLQFQRTRQRATLSAAVIREQKLGLNAVIEAQEAERKRIAKDLHDGIAQELVALKLGFDALGRRVGKVAPEESARFDELKTQLDDSCTEVRSIAHVMSPPVLEKHGLAPSLELLVQHTMQHAGLKANLNAHDLPRRLDEKIEIGLYRITQELLNNIIKHANAARVVIELYAAGSDLVLRVEDDGVGYNFEEARARGSMGLLNILSRASALGGAFVTERNQPQGTVALVRIPI